MQAVLAIGGSDSSGCAGIAADIRAITAAGAHAACALTCVTSQTRHGIVDLRPVDELAIRAQMAAAFADLPIAAVKSGAIATDRAAEIIAEELSTRSGLPYVLDPVIAATSGSRIASPETVAAIRRHLFPLATLVTPNAPEAAALVDFPVRTIADAARAGRALIGLGCRAVLVKGGHLDERVGTDVLVTAKSVNVFAGEPIDNANTRGTGCTLASAIAACLANGHDLESAVIAARALVADAIRGGYDLDGRGPADAFAAFRAPGGGFALPPRNEAARA